jgi:hypothetical protein
MAWIEQTRSRYRVRYRYHSVIYTDSAHADPAVAVERRDIFEAGARRRARLFYPDLAPKLCDWIAVWQASHAVSVAAAVRDDSLLRNHVLPRFGGTRLSAIDTLAVQAFVLDLGLRGGR